MYMDKSIVLKEIEKNEYNSEIFLNRYFGSLIKENDENKIIKSVNKLKNEIQEQKHYINNKIREEVENYKDKIHEMKTHTHIMNEKLLNIKIINRRNENITSMKQKNKLCELNINKKEHQEEETEIKKDKFEENKKDEDDVEDQDENEDESEYEKLFEEEKKDDDDDDEEFKLYESKNNLNFENSLIKSIETKTKLENIKKGLLFLKVFPMLEKDINDLFSTSKNMKLSIDDKIKNAFTLLKKLIYINENEEVITYFKEYSLFNNSLYSNKFFDDFFTLLNDILYSYIFDKTSFEVNDILKAYVTLFKTYMKFTNMKEYKNEDLINEIIKKIIEFIIINFNKTFLKFVHSENDSFIYNSITNFYEYFTTFIEERKEIMKRMILIVVHIVNNKSKENLNESSNKLDTYTYSPLNDKSITELSSVEVERNEIFNEKENKLNEKNNLTVITIEKKNYEEKERVNGYFKCEGNNINEDFRFIEDYFVHLFKESIYLVCDYIENSDAIKNLNDSNKIDKTALNKKKIFIFKIMDSLKISLNILSNSSFFISKKNLFERILKESSFISKSLIDEYLINVTSVTHFDMECFENINLKVSNFDRNNFLFEDKLVMFFSDMQKDIKNTIEKKYYEVDNKDICNHHFFRFVIFFSFISNHDTEFLFLFINVYNFLYEIIYNIKEEIKKIKNAADNKKKNQININESIQLKEEFNVYNKVIDYIKNIIVIFTKLLNIFNDIIKEYEHFSSFIFEKTYNYFKSNNIFNRISKFYLQKKKYPTEIEANILHIHNFFFNDDFSEKLINEKNKKTPINVNVSNNINSNENKLSLSQENEIKEKKEENFSNIGTAQVNELVSYSSLDINLVIENEEYGKHLFKSSLSKLNEIKNTILKNIIYFSLIPLYDYLNKYVSKIISFNDNEKIENFDPEENICLIVETIFTYIEIFYENKNEYVLQLLFFHLSEKYVFYIKNINNINKNMVLQIQSDVNYLINVCKKFKIKNYKQFWLLYHSISFSLTLKNDCDLNVQSFEIYLNENIKNENELSFNITNDDILKSTFYIKQFLSHQQIKN